MRFMLIVLLLSAGRSSCAQEYILKNEKLIFSLKTLSGKTLMIAQDSSENYLVYRYGMDSLIELEFPKNKSNSWKKFKFSSYSRGGGAENLAMDIDYLFFDIKPFRYVVYWTYYSVSENTDCGIIVIDLKTEKETNIYGDITTIRGSLETLRWNELITESNEFY